MQALLRLIDSAEQAAAAIAICIKKKATINHKKHDVVLSESILKEGGFSTNFGGYGSYSRIGLGEFFANRWIIKGFNDPRRKPFTGLSVWFAGERWARSIKEMQTRICKMGGEIARSINVADIIVFCDTALKLPPSQVSLLVDEATFQRALPMVREKPTATTRSAKSLDRSTVNLWKLLSTRDLATIRQGLNLAAAIGGQWDDITADVKVNAKTGTLERGSRFTVSGPAQRFLDLALLGLLSIAPAGSRAAQLRGEIKKLDLILADIPALKGFGALESLRIKLAQGVHADDLCALDALPSLINLSITPEEVKSVDVSLGSLDGLNAPLLNGIEITNVGIRSIQALSLCRSLVAVDLSANRSLASIKALSGSVSTLRHLVLEDCSALKSIDPIAGANLTRIVLRNCNEITSLKALSACEGFDELSLTGCQGLSSLDGIEAKLVRCPPQEHEKNEFSLQGCSALTSLASFPRLCSTFDTLNLDNTALTSLDGIEDAQNITNLSMKSTPVQDISSLAKIRNLKKVSLSYSEELEDSSTLGELEFLEEVDLTSSAKLTKLPKLWKSDLRALSVSNCGALKSLGTLPQSLEMLGGSLVIDLDGCSMLESIAPIAHTKLHQAKYISLRECESLASLDGLRGFASLEEINISSHLKDASALSSHRGLLVRFFVGDLKSLPPDLGKLLGAIPKLKLEIMDADNLTECSSLSALTNLTSLDLTSVRKLKDIRWIVGLSDLKEMKLSVKSPSGSIPKIEIFDSVTTIRKLQSATCAQFKMKLPNHLKLDSKTKKNTTRKASVIVKDFKAGPTLATLAELRKTLARLSKEGDAGIFDELVDGTDPDDAFIGNSEAIGTLFKGVKVKDRATARLALASILALAPDDADVAVKIRSEIRTIKLEFPESASIEDMPALNRFHALSRLEITGLPGNSMDFCKGISSLKELYIYRAENLKSLKGIEGSIEMTNITISDCPQLVDINVISKMPRLASTWLRNTGRISDVEFIKGLRAITDLDIIVDSRTSLTPFASAPWINSLSLRIHESCPDLSSLRFIKNLKLITTHDLMRPPINVSWNVTLPDLCELSVRGGVHDFKEMNAPKLVSANFEGCCAFENDFRGLGGVTKLKFRPWHAEYPWYAEYKANSLDGLQDSVIEELDLSAFKDSLKDLSAIGAMAQLRELRLPVLDRGVLETITSANQIESLTCRGFEGSLAWVGSLKGLRVLGLQHSGLLTDMEIISGLPRLETVLLRGAKSKRESWPEAIRGKLDYRR